MLLFLTVLHCISYSSAFEFRASICDDLYIDFTRNLAIFPVECLDSQDFSHIFLVFIISFPLHVEHILAMPWLVVYCMLVPSLGSTDDEFKSEEPVEYVHKERGFHTTVNISGKMIITPDISTIFAC